MEGCTSAHVACVKHICIETHVGMCTTRKHVAGVGLTYEHGTWLHVLSMRVKHVSPCTRMLLHCLPPHGALLWLLQPLQQYVGVFWVCFGCFCVYCGCVFMGVFWVEMLFMGVEGVDEVYNGMCFS